MYRSSPLRSTLNTNLTTGLGMCKVYTEAVHCVAFWTRTLSQVWACVKYVPKQPTTHHAPKVCSQCVKQTLTPDLHWLRGRGVICAPHSGSSAPRTPGSSAHRVQGHLCTVPRPAPSPPVHFVVSLCCCCCRCRRRCPSGILPARLGRVLLLCIGM